MKPVRALDEARKELDSAVAFYESRRPGLGRSFLNAYSASISLNRLLPRGARKIRGDVRQRSIPDYPYNILYRVMDDEILIIAVCHQRRSPMYRKIEESPAVYICHPVRLPDGSRIT